MKRSFRLLFVLSLFTCIASAQQTNESNFVLKGIFTGKHTHVLRLSYKDENGRTIQQTAHIINGRFLFRGFISSPISAGISADIKITPNGPDVSNYNEVFLSPGLMTIALKENNFDHAVLTGSPVQGEWAEAQPLAIQMTALSSKGPCDAISEPLSY